MYSIKFLLLVTGLCLAADSKLSGQEDAAVLTGEEIQKKLVGVYQERIGHIDVVRETFGDLLKKICEKSESDKTELLENTGEVLSNFHDATNKCLTNLNTVKEKISTNPKVNQKMVDFLVRSTIKYLENADITLDKLISALSCETESFTEYRKSVSVLKKDVDLEGVFKTQEDAVELTEGTIELLIKRLDSLSEEMKKDIIARLNELSEYASKDESEETESGIKKGVKKLSFEDTEGNGDRCTSLTNPRQ